MHLCADEIVIITIDPRTGKLNMRDTGDLAAAGRGLRFSALSEKLNENPSRLFEVLVRLRWNVSNNNLRPSCIFTYLCRPSPNWRNTKQIIWDYSAIAVAISPKKVASMALHLTDFADKNVEVQKLGPAARGTLYIQLSTFPNHYLVLVITDDDFRYALISAQVLADSIYANMIMGDIAWLDVRRIRGENEVFINECLEEEFSISAAGVKRTRAADDDTGMKTNNR